MSFDTSTEQTEYFLALKWTKFKYLKVIISLIDVDYAEFMKEQANPDKSLSQTSLPDPTEN